METKYHKVISFIILFLIIPLAAGGIVSAAETKRVVVVPFKINAEKDLTFLRDGIVDMLASRLAWEDKVTVLSREETAKVLDAVSYPITESKARDIGSSLKADYVLYGSLTVFGHSVSIDSKMIDVSGNKPPMAFFNQGKGMDEVIPDINQFATDINERIFGRVGESRKIPVQQQVEQEQTELRAHPEKLFESGVVDEGEAGPGAPAPGAGFIAEPGTSARSAQFWKSQSFKERIEGLAIGDVDQDGKQETVLITSHTVEVYRFEKNRFYKVDTIADRGLDNLLGVDVADINGNGYPEIFVSALNPARKGISSFVMEFDGKTYVEIVKNSHWYYRVATHPARGKILLGQRQPGETPFSGTISEMVWGNSEYEAANQVMRSNRASVLGFALGNVMHDGAEIAAAYDNLDYLRLYELDGKEAWKDGEHTGGTSKYFELPNAGSHDMKNYAFFPVRIQIADIDRNGKNEVISLNNERFSKYMEFRSFIKGKIEIRGWDGIGLNVLWRTRPLSGHFSDFALGDFDNDGKDELIAGLIIKTGSVVGTTPKSVVIAYELK